jgi:membrane fusion protein, multidrug efflux system
MSKKRIVVALIGFAAVGIAIGVAFQLGDTAAPAATRTAPPLVPVVASKVASGDVPIYLRGVGTVIAYNNVLIRSQITGQLVSINFKQGQTVKQGDLLAQIDPRPYQAQLDQAIANRKRDQAQLVNAEANLNRYLPLEKKGFATPQLTDTQKAQVDELKAVVESDEAVIESAKVNLSYTKLMSPIDGVTGIRQIDLGNVIHPSDPNGLVDVTQIQPISIIFTLPETTFPQVHQQSSKGPISVLAYTQDDKTMLDEGKLVLVNNQIIQSTGSIQLRANFPNKQGTLWPGYLVNCRLLLSTRHDGLTVPAAVVQQGPNGSYAYVINSDGSVATRPIKVAQISDGQALIDSGLKANEQVVVDGQYKLRPGDHVTILSGKAAEEAEAQSAMQAPIP